MSVGPQPSLLLRVSNKDGQVMPGPRLRPVNLSAVPAAVHAAMKEALGMDCPVVIDDQLPAGRMQLRVGRRE